MRLDFTLPINLYDKNECFKLNIRKCLITYLTFFVSFRIEDE